MQQSITTTTRTTKRTGEGEIPFFFVLLNDQRHYDCFCEEKKLEISFIH